ISIDQDLAAVMRNEAVDNFQQSRLAASAGANYADELIFTDAKTHVRESLDLCGVVFDRFLKAFRDPLDLNHLSSLTLGVQNVQVVKQINFPVRFERLELFERLEPSCLFPGKELVVLARFIRAGISREVHAVKYFVRRLGFFWKIIWRHGFGGVEN